ncbi:HNH endonuclease [Kitasatospora sp. NPDC048545]|uniref:HNH endonuclease n=1 Tax=Kitasatospora sp. NPDC048545 TaxID=3157208 RepID=UPI0033CB4061
MWTGNINAGGYGQIRDAKGKTVRVHRASYAEFVGPIPDDLVLDHLCSVRHCFNPEHLEAVTIQVNVRRAWERASAHSRPPGFPANLTGREAEVLFYTHQGHATRDIVQLLGCSAGAVRNARASACRKLGARDAEHAAQIIDAQNGTAQ